MVGRTRDRIGQLLQLLDPEAGRRTDAFREGSLKAGIDLER